MIYAVSVIYIAKEDEAFYAAKFSQEVKDQNTPPVPRETARKMPTVTFVWCWVLMR